MKSPKSKADANISFQEKDTVSHGIRIDWIFILDMWTCGHMSLIFHILSFLLRRLEAFTSVPNFALSLYTILSETLHHCITPLTEVWLSSSFWLDSWHQTESTAGAPCKWCLCVRKRCQISVVFDVKKPEGIRFTSVCHINDKSGMAFPHQCAEGRTESKHMQSNINGLRHRIQMRRISMDQQIATFLLWKKNVQQCLKPNVQISNQQHQAVWLRDWQQWSSAWLLSTRHNCRRKDGPTMNIERTRCKGACLSGGTSNGSTLAAGGSLFCR